MTHATPLEDLVRDLSQRVRVARGILADRYRPGEYTHGPGGRIERALAVLDGQNGVPVPADPAVSGAFNLQLTSRRRTRLSPTLESTGDLSELCGATERLVKTLGMKIGEGDPEDLSALARVGQAYEDALNAAVVGLRRNRSLTEIGRVLGMTPQNVAKRWPAR